MLRDYILLYDPFKLTGTDGFLNYKMSGFGSGKQNKNSTSNNGGGFAIIIIISTVFLLFKTCGE